MRNLAACLVMIVLAGCATQEQRAAEAARLAEQQHQWEESMRASIDQTCAYAKADPMKYGDCRRQTVMFLYQMQTQELQAQRQQNAASAAWAAQVIKNTQSAKPVQTNCSPTYGGGITCQSQ